MASRIAIVLGAGPNIGARTIETFESKGYKVAYASRSARDSGDNGSTMAVQCDLSHPASVTTLFDTVREKWGEPSVIVYNGTVGRCCTHSTHASRVPNLFGYW